MLFQSRKIKFIAFLMIAVLFVTACGLLTPLAPAEAPTAPAVSPTESLPADQIQDDTNSAGETGPGESEGQSGETVNVSPPNDLDETFESFWEVRELLERYYFEQPVDDAVLAQGAIDGLQAYAEIPAVEISDETASDFAKAADTPRDAQDAFLPFWKAWAAYSQNDTGLYTAAISGLVDSLGDQHTSYMDPDQFRQANIPVDGSYEGIGAWVDPNNDYLTIVSPMPDSPAEKAGLQPGDEVVAVDGEDMTGIDGNLVIRRVLGPAGSDVVLTIRREGTEDFDVTITRAEIVVPSIDGRILEDTNLAYIQLISFGETTTDDLRDLLTELLSQNPDGLIFDLRNNGGGLLTTSVEVTSEFIPDGVVLYEVYGEGDTDTFRVTGDGLATDIPMVVLINEGSASASEIVAGAIQDYERAPLVGTTSFGKGSVQNWIPLSNNGAVRITIAQWYTPNDRLIHEIGLAPDYLVEITDADLEAGLDPQLEKAIELLTQNQ